MSSKRHQAAAGAGAMTRLDLGGEDAEDIAVVAAVRLAGIAIGCAAYQIPATFSLFTDKDRVGGRAMLAEPYAGQRFVKARTHFLRFTAYATAVLCGRAAMLELLGHCTGCEHDEADASRFISARARRRVRKPERRQIVEAELRPRAARLMRDRRESLLEVAVALVTGATLCTADVRRLVYPAQSKLH